ncbi:MAG: glycosyltransferase family 4 protein [Anaerosomatales bacterium]|jgi:glycosyltransferase involved in cell wall biosynthesis|nr:glycosyltransferase family 4 protein [Coriobacteriia bacterium]MDI6693148.1 glycosyltransferase family 4 protein [Anaerosomatales bacterium]
MQRLSEGLAAMGHEVTVATAFCQARQGVREHNGVRIAEFDVRGNEAEGYRGDVAGFTEFVRSFDCDVMLNYAAQICTTDLVFPLLPNLSCGKVIVPCGYSRLRDPAYATYFRKMPERLRQYDRAVYMSSNYQDNRFSDEHGLTNGVVIPNGASLVEFERPRSGFREAYGIYEASLILCVGNLMDIKGQRDVHAAFSRSGLKDAALVFIGSEINRYVTGAMRTRNGPAYDVRRKVNILRHELFESAIHPDRRHRYELDSPAGTRSIVLAGVPRDMVLAAYFEADVFAFASKVECAPLVIYESMAAGLPWISFPAGNIPELEGGIVVDDVDAMAEEMSRLIDRPNVRERLGAQGRAAWLERYTWESIVKQYERLYREVSSLA